MQFNQSTKQSNSKQYSDSRYSFTVGKSMLQSAKNTARTSRFLPLKQGAFAEACFLELFYFSKKKKKKVKCSDQIWCCWRTPLICYTLVKFMVRFHTTKPTHLPLILSKGDLTNTSYHFNHVHDTIGPISLNDIDNSNEWLTGRI